MTRLNYDDQVHAKSQPTSSAIVFPPSKSKLTSTKQRLSYVLSGGVWIFPAFCFNGSFPSQHKPSRGNWELKCSAEHLSFHYLLFLILPPFCFCSITIPFISFCINNVLFFLCRSILIMLCLEIHDRPDNQADCKEASIPKGLNQIYVQCYTFKINLISTSPLL